MIKTTSGTTLECVSNKDNSRLEVGCLYQIVDQDNDIVSVIKSGDFSGGVKSITASSGCFRLHASNK